MTQEEMREKREDKRKANDDKEEQKHHRGSKSKGRDKKELEAEEKAEQAETEKRKAEELDMDTNGWPVEDHRIFADIAKQHNNRMEEECMKEIQAALPYMLEDELHQHRK